MHENELDITKPGESKPIFCQFLAPSFYCSPAVPGSSSRSVQEPLWLLVSANERKKRASEIKRQEGENL